MHYRSMSSDRRSFFDRINERVIATDAPKRESSFDVQNSQLAADSVLDPLAGSFRRGAPDTFSSPRAWGTEEIPDSILLFASHREPVVRLLVSGIAADIFDNWFKVVDPDDPDDTGLNDAVQRVLTDLNAKQEFIRLFIFERRYGTAIMLLGYTSFGDSSWQNPIYETSVGLNNPKKFTGDGEILQITPYPWSVIDVEKTDTDSSSLRFGLPDTYKITRGMTAESSSALAAETVETKVNWSRLIHAATRLDEHTFEGESIVKAIYDDSTGFRNSRWAQYETIFRVGSGFPFFKFPWATKEQIATWIAEGHVTRLNARGFFVGGEEEESVEFVGPKGVSLDPGPYNEMALEALSMGTRIPKDILRGASAGTISGSDVNERQKYQMISSEQSLVEPVVRELINRLIDAGQIEYKDGRRGEVPKNYLIDWNYPEIVNEKDRATIDFLAERGKTESMNYLTVNELRAKEGLGPVDGGDIVIGIEKQKKVQPVAQERPDPKERRPTERSKED